MTANNKPTVAKWGFTLIISPLLAVGVGIVYMYGLVRRIRNRSTGWQPWFAFRPVVLNDRRKVWFRLVQRRKLGNGFTSYRGQR